MKKIAFICLVLLVVSGAVSGFWGGGKTLAADSTSTSTVTVITTTTNTQTVTPTETVEVTPTYIWIIIAAGIILVAVLAFLIMRPKRK
jgi:hypothetical protein